MLVVAGFVFAAVPIGGRPTTALPQHVEHVAFFFAVGASLACGYPRRYRLVAALVTGLPAAIQLIQVWAPGRHPRLADALAGMIGAWLGLLAMAAFERVVRSRTAGVSLAPARAERRRKP
jgi:VanZ family protein